MEREGPHIASYPVDGDHKVERVRYTEPEQGKENGRVWINKKQYFENVPNEVWDFHIGGYQVCEKWLKDRKGRTLSYDDINHYMKIVSAISETIRIMAEIDETIEEHGGWIAARNLPDRGAVFSFGVKPPVGVDAREAGKRFIQSLQLFSHLANVGDVRSLVIHPASTTHQQLSDEELRIAGIGPEMIRLSIGLETVDDLLWDLDRALWSIDKE